MADPDFGTPQARVELLRWLMMVVLVVLMVESLLANRFYRRAAPEAEAGAKAGEPGA